MKLSQLHYRLQLLRTKGIGYLSFRYLMQIYSTAKLALQTLTKTHVIPSMESICIEIKRTHEYGAEFMCFDDPYFPISLNICNSIPIIIYKGNKELLKHHSMIGIIGSRRSSAIGLHFTNDLSLHISKHSIVVSGMASGIDKIAHQSALKCNGQTIGVIAGGIDTMYPLSNTDLFISMYKKGLILAYAPIGSPIDITSFIIRNNIIIDLCSVICMVEGKINSGTVSTAISTIKNKKKLYVVPGHPYDNNYSGNIHIINNYLNDIRILSDISDINPLLLNYELKTHQEFSEIYNYSNYIAIKNLISVTPIHISELEKYTNIDIFEILSILSTMEINKEILVSNQTICLINNV